MVFISHHLDEIKRIGDVVTVLRDGKYIDTVKADTPEKELVRLMVGRNIDNQYPHTGYPQREVLLKVDGLTRQGAIDDVSFELHAGEVVGLAGLVGAGRTEVIRAILELIATTQALFMWRAGNCVKGISPGALPRM